MVHHTSVEQSKKLLELGLSPETADMSYRFHTGYGEYYPSFGGTQKDSDIPCWTVGALLEAMPRVEDNYPIMLRTNNFKLTYADKKGYCIRLETGSLLDVCYNMMIWLLENGYINTK